jgi:hypothetical protein
MKKGEIERMEEQLETIEPKPEDFMERRIHHIPFAKIVFWLNLQSRKDDFIYAKDLEKFMKVSGSYAFDLLSRLVNAGIMKKNHTGNIVEYHFIKNGDSPLIWNYLDKAKKTLGLK